MSELSTFSSAAKGLTKNPLGIIALFIVLVYGFASLTLGVTSRLEATERLILVWFLVLFPFAVLFLFGWLVSNYHEHLYSPADYRSDDAFHKSKKLSEFRVAELTAEQNHLKARIKETIFETLPADETDPARLQKVVEQVIADVNRSSNITVDARTFLDDANAVFTFPVAAFQSLGDLTNEVYFKLSKKVRPFQYGHTWVLRNGNSKSIIKTLRMLVNAPPGKPLDDTRPLSEVGILPGMTLIVDGANNGT